jgi:bleomycin hydrolase
MQTSHCINVSKPKTSVDASKSILRKKIYRKVKPMITHTKPDKIIKTKKSGELDPKQVGKFIESKQHDKTNIVISNAFQMMDFNKITTNSETVDKSNHIFSNEIDKQVNPIDQEHAGLCWACGGMTMCRREIIKKLNLEKDFNFSLNYILFWDKVEKCNYFMDYIIKNRNKNFDSSAIQNVISSPIGDGGWWYTFVDLVNKYGMIPDSIYRRRFSSKNTSNLNKLLKHKLREFASLVLSPNDLTDICDLSSNSDSDQSSSDQDSDESSDQDSDQSPDQDSDESSDQDSNQSSDQNSDQLSNNIKIEMLDLNELKKKYLETIILILKKIIGAPPCPDSVFNWTYKSVSGGKITLKDLTPLSFYKNYCNVKFDDYVCCINDPRPRHPYMRSYKKRTVDCMVMDRKNTHSHILLNLQSSDIIQLIMKQIDQGIPVWFSCDVDKFSSHKYNLLDIALYDIDMPFNTSFTSMTKADRLDFCDSRPSHAMAIIGYDICTDSNKPIDSDSNNHNVSTFDSPDQSSFSNTRSDKKRKTIRNETNDDCTINHQLETNNKRNMKKFKTADNLPPVSEKPITGMQCEKYYNDGAKKVIKFKVENSWGDVGDKNGQYVMTTEWFNMFGYEVVINMNCLTREQKLALKKKPIILEEGDPLSRSEFY